MFTKKISDYFLNYHNLKNLIFPNFIFWPIKLLLDSSLRTIHIFIYVAIQNLYYNLLINTSHMYTRKRTVVKCYLNNVRDAKVASQVSNPIADQIKAKTIWQNVFTRVAFSVNKHLIHYVFVYIWQHTHICTSSGIY